MKRVSLKVGNTMVVTEWSFEPFVRTFKELIYLVSDKNISIGTETAHVFNLFLR